jgi:benzoyl-CoA reductase/2-hydroxyglutaryl-CoA dehydratase subunit BcrC/BadD/HgdB
MTFRRVQYEAAGRVAGPLLMAIENRRAARKRRRRAPREHSFGPPLESAVKMKDLMSVYYYQGRWADGAVPVAWVTSGFPVELLRPFGFYVAYPENHAALCAARHMMPALAEVAEKEGYSRDLCAYARCDLGSVMSRKTPLGRLPKPDLVAVCNNICETVLYWFRALADYFEVPLFLLDAPFVYGDFKRRHLQYVVDQLEELREVAATITGRQVSGEEIEEAGALGREASRLWRECLATGRSRPAPWTGFDQFILMAPIVALRGTKKCNAFYRHLRDELRDRAGRGIGAIKNEKHRLLWDNIPVWPKLRDLSRLFAENGFNFVAATYTNSWCESVDLYDPGDPVFSVARMISNTLLNRDLQNRLRIMKQLVGDYQLDGAVFHSDRSCKPYSVGQYDLKDRLSSELDVPVVVLEADHADPRSYSAEQVETRLQAFMEGFQ